jgi:hypothetical protein
MAYDKAKAHDYYEKYTKKGLKKGRKKGKKKAKSTKIKTQSLIGVSSGGLNSDGAIEAALVKDRIKKEMNEALKSAKTDAERDDIKRAYSKKANAEIEKLKHDPKFAKVTKKKEKKQKAPKSPKSSSSKGSSSKGSSSKGSSSKGSSSKSTSAKSSTSAKASTSAVKAEQAKTEEQPKTESERTLDTIKDLQAKLDTMTEEQKELAKELISSLIDEYKKKLLGGEGDDGRGVQADR